MKKLVLLVFALVAVATFAGVLEPFKQFTREDYNEFKRGDQNWLGAQLITLNVHGGSGVWLSNYVASFDGGKVPDLNGNVYDMAGNQKYGYIYKSDLPDLTTTNYADKIHWADGRYYDSIIYTATTDPSVTAETRGWFLDYFEDDAEIYLVMTTLPEDGSETVNSYQYVQGGPEDPTTLMSRVDGTTDGAGNIRVNFGIDNGTYGDGIGIGREFVAVYDDGSIDYANLPRAAGGPLPGLLFVGLLSMGTVFSASRMKKRS